MNFVLNIELRWVIILVGMISRQLEKIGFNIEFYMWMWK